MASIKYTETVQVELAPGTTVVEFNNEFNLQDAKKIVGIEAYSASQVDKTYNQKTVINDTAFKSAYLSLQTLGDSKERIKVFPLRSLNPALNSGIIKELDVPQIDPAKCKLTFGNPSAIQAGEYALIIFHLEK